MEKTYVVQLPYSVTNKGKFFRVTEVHSWQKYVNGESYVYEYTSFPTYNAARTACDRMNENAK